VAESFRYIIVGRGRWASRMRNILAGENRSVVLIEESRRAISEDPDSYRDRLLSAYKAGRAQIAWLCVPPGEHIPVMIQAAIEAGLHVIIEKPWMCTAEETNQLQLLAKYQKLVLAIHYEYCLMQEVEDWRQNWNGGNGLRFRGRIKVNRPDHIGLPALDNLGSHLFSIHEYCVSDSVIAEIDCGYEQPDERRVWLEDGSGGAMTEIDLLANKEPIIQRFVVCVESAATQGGDFPFGLPFALRVAKRSEMWKRSSQRSAES